MKFCLITVVCAVMSAVASGCCDVPCEPVCHPGSIEPAAVISVPSAAPIQVTR